MSTDDMSVGRVRTFQGKKTIAATFGVFARKNNSGWIEICLTGDKTNFKITWVTNNPNSKKRYHPNMFKKLRNLLKAYGKWPFGEEGSETKNKSRVA